jgi:hypothetical protein
LFFLGFVVFVGIVTVFGDPVMTYDLLDIYSLERVNVEDVGHEVGEFWGKA